MLNFCARLGVESVIDYTSEDFAARVQGVDVVLDSMGGEIWERSLKSLKRSGRLVLIVGVANEEQAHASGVRACGILVHPDQIQLREISRLLAEQRLRIYAAQTLPLQEAERTHELLETHHVRGKVVLEVG